MAHSTESRLTSAIRLALKSEGCYVNKNVGGPNSQGRPDLEGCYRGCHFGLEVKQPGKEKNVTKLQKSHLDGITAAGGYAEVVTSVAQGLAMIQFLNEELDYDG